MLAVTDLEGILGKENRIKGRETQEEAWGRTVKQM